MLSQGLPPVAFFLHSCPRHSEVLALSRKTIAHLRHCQSLGAAGRRATRVQLRCPDAVCEHALRCSTLGATHPLTGEQFWPNSLFAGSCAAPRLSQGPAGRTLLLGTVSRAVWPQAPPHPQPSYGAHILLPRAPRGGFGGCSAVLRPLPSSRRECAGTRRRGLPSLSSGCPVSRGTLERGCAGLLRDFPSFQAQLQSKNVNWCGQQFKTVSQCFLI